MVSEKTHWAQEKMVLFVLKLWISLIFLQKKYKVLRIIVIESITFSSQTNF